MTQISKAALDILAERARQIEAEGWTPEHDDQHDQGQLTRAAITYAMVTAGGILTPNYVQRVLDEGWWPWATEWFKPAPNFRRCLVKAASLLIAEIERLDRKAAT